MQRSDWIPVGIVGALVAGVAALILGAPRPAERVAMATSDTAVAAIDTAATPAADGGSARGNMTAGRPGEVRVRLVRSGNPAPARDREEIRRHLLQGAPGTYIGDILAAQDSQLVRWPDNTVLRVWIAPTAQASDWHASYVDTVRAAFAKWSAVNMPVGIQFVNDSASATVRVHWLDRFAEGGTIGQTQQTWDQYHWLVAGDISIAMHTVSGTVLDGGWVRATALHEIGHLLGLNHSGTADDLMAPQAHALDLSRADLATLRLLYALPPGSAK